MGFVSFRVLEMIPDPSNFLMDIGISLNLHLEDVEARSSTYYIDMAIPTDYSMTENSVGFPKRKVSRQWIASSTVQLLRISFKEMASFVT